MKNEDDEMVAEFIGWTKKGKAKKARWIDQDLQVQELNFGRDWNQLMIAIKAIHVLDDVSEEVDQMRDELVQNMMVGSRSSTHVNVVDIINEINDEREKTVNSMEFLMGELEKLPEDKANKVKAKLIDLLQEQLVE